MLLTLYRSPEVVRGTSWRPVEHEIEQRRRLEVLHWMPELRPTTRRKSGSRPGTYRMKHETTVIDPAELSRAGAEQKYTPAQIEDQYKRGKFIEGFVFVRALSAFVHEDEVAKIEAKAGQIGPGSVIAKGADVEEGAAIGAFVELEKGAKVLHGAFVGGDSVVRKGGIIGEGSHIDRGSYIGQFATVGYNVRPHPDMDAEASNSMLVVESRANIYPGVQLGQHDRIGRGSQVLSNVWLDDDVTIGRSVFVGPGEWVGEMAQIRDNVHIAGEGLIGAESVIGHSAIIGLRVHLPSPSFIDDGALISRPATPERAAAGLPGSMFDALDARLRDEQ